MTAVEGYWAIGEHGSLNSTIAICPCGNPTYFQLHSNQIPRTRFGRSVSHIDGPKVEAIYEEARTCTAYVAYTAAVMLCRKLLMNMAVHHGANSNGTFAYYVDYLDSNHFVPPNGKAWVDPIRAKGNEATHEIDLMDETDAKRILNFSQSLLIFVYEMKAI